MKKERMFLNTLKVAVVGSMLTIGMTMAACGGAADGEGEGDDSTGTAAEPTPEPEPEPEVIDTATVDTAAVVG